MTNSKDNRVKPNPTRKEHEYKNNSLGADVCKNCGHFATVPDWPPYCTPTRKERKEEYPPITKPEWGERFDKWWVERFGEEYKDTFPQGDLKAFISDLLKQQKEEQNRISNSGRKLYQDGYKQAKQDLVGKIEKLTKTVNLGKYSEKDFANQKSMAMEIERDSKRHLMLVDQIISLIQEDE